MKLIQVVAVAAITAVITVVAVLGLTNETNNNDAVANFSSTIPAAEGGEDPALTDFKRGLDNMDKERQANLDAMDKTLNSMHEKILENKAENQQSEIDSLKSQLNNKSSQVGRQ